MKASREGNMEEFRGRKEKGEMELNYDLQNKKNKYCKIIKRRHMKPSSPISREPTETICKK